MQEWPRWQWENWAMAQCSHLAAYSSALVTTAKPPTLQDSQNTSSFDFNPQDWFPLRFPKDSLQLKIYNNQNWPLSYVYLASNLICWYYQKDWLIHKIWNNTATKKGCYTYTMMPHTRCIPVKNGHFLSYTKTYTVCSVEFSIYVYCLYTKKSLIPTHIQIEFQTPLIYHFIAFLYYLIRHY